MGNSFSNKLILIVVLACGSACAFAKDKKGFLDGAMSFMQPCIDRANPTKLNSEQQNVANALKDLIGSETLVGTEWKGESGVSVKITADKDNNILVTLHGKPALPPENFHPPVEKMEEGYIKNKILSRLVEVRAAMEQDTGFPFTTEICKDKVSVYLNPKGSGAGRIRLFNGDVDGLIMNWIVPGSLYPDVLKKVSPGT